MFANLYENLRAINNDKTLQTVTPDGLAPWEKELFASIQDSMQSYLARQANLIAKLRSNIGISLPAIRSVVAAILDPLGIPFEILPLSGQTNGNGTGAWVLEVSTLEFDTYLSFLDPLIGEPQGGGLTPLDCDLDYAAAGLTLQQLQEIQLTAYAYELRIYGNADAATLAILDKILTAQEPARSKHFIINNAVPPSTPPDALTEEWTPEFLYWWTS